MIKVVIFDIGGVVLISKYIFVHKHVLRIIEFALRRIRRALGLPARDPWFIIKLYRILMEPDEELIKLIKDLRSAGYKTAVLSNTTSEKKNLANEWGVYKYFDNLIISGELGVKKPERKIYEIALQRVGVKPEECVFIDNNAENLVPADRMGMKTILFKNTEQLKEDLAELGVKW